MATHFSILAWRNPVNRGVVGYSPWDHKESDTTEQVSTAQHSYIMSRDSCIHTHTHTHTQTHTHAHTWAYEDEISPNT